MKEYRSQLHIFRLLCSVVLAALWLPCAHAQVPDNRNLAIKQQGQPIATERRVALVIGNSAYQRGPLKNPVNDAVDVAQKLRGMGFEVVERTNLKSSQIGRTLREFRARLTPGAVAVFFYAGHGLQIRGENYLPAVDADIEGEEDVPNQSIAVRQVMEVMEDAKTRLNLAFLDACRNNPYARSFRSGGEGLARISAPSGTLISFATRPGSVAADGTGRNGLYTTHLLTAMETPNMPVELMLKRVTTGVKGASRGMQEPWMEGSIEGDFYFRVAALQQGGSGTVTDAGSQQDLVDRAVQDAVRRANDQAARERAELQTTMQKLIEQALARQSAMSNGGAPDNLPAVTVQPAAPATAVAGLGPSTTLATTRPLAFVSGKSPQPGDEWEYLAREEVWGKQRRILWRVKGIAPASGVLEELQVDGQKIQEWAFDGNAVFVSVPIAANFMFGPHWQGGALSVLSVAGNGDCSQRLRCQFVSRVVGKERISVPAGTFDATRIEGDITISFSGANAGTPGRFTIWYSEIDRRLVKQVVYIRNTNAGLYLNETVELQAARTSQN